MDEHHGASSLGMEEGVVAAASYLGFLGIVMLIIERKSSFVRFHAVQSTLGFALILIFYLIVEWCGLYYIWWAPGTMAFCFSLYMMYRAYYGDEYKLPVIGPLAFGAIYDTEPDDDEVAGARPASNGRSAGGV